MSNEYIDKIRADFPFLAAHQEQYGGTYTYLDNAATTQKPKVVIDTITDFYKKYNAPIHRGIYAQAEFVTAQYESARATLAYFIDAEPQEIVFTSGTTEGINFISQSWARKELKAGDEIILSMLEHHANLLPWYRVAEETGARITFIPITETGNLDYDWYQSHISKRTKLVAITGCSNAVGTSVNLAQIIDVAHVHGAKVLIDIAQVVGYEPISMRQLRPDFAVFSGHKMGGPTGIGVLYIHQNIQDCVEPYQVGGGMVQNVSLISAEWAKPPRKFEAGTPPIAQAIGLAAACQYLASIDYERHATQYKKLMNSLIDGLQQLPAIQLFGPIDQLRQRGHLLSFNVKDIHAHDVAAFLDVSSIAVRAGNHCAQPLFSQLGIAGSVRVSFFVYNTLADVSHLLEELQHMLKSMCEILITI